MKIDFTQNRRFWDKVDMRKDEGCWEWLACKSTDGYGKYRTTEKSHRAPRYLFEMSGHKLTRQDFILHSCDNPACVNPNHLRIGTAQENSLDMVKRGRDNNLKEKARLWRENLTEEDKKLIALKTTGELNGMYGKTHSQEAREIISQTKKNNPTQRSSVNGRFVSTKSF